MEMGRWQSWPKIKELLSVRRLYRLLAPRAYTVIMFGALFCTLAVKLFHSLRYDLLDEYLSWILTDISVLLTVEALLATICFRWPRRWVIRGATVVAAVTCTWSVMNAGWLIRTGTQILPAVLLPLGRDPLNTLGIVGISLLKMPKAAVILLAPSAVALTFFFSVLAKPLQPNYQRRLFVTRIFASLVIIAAAVLVQQVILQPGSAQIVFSGLRYNCQQRAVLSLLSPEFGHLDKADFANAKREIPTLDEIEIAIRPQHINHNVVVVVLEGIQYRYTSLVDKRHDLTPYLDSLARQGVEFQDARSTLTHTTKALFALLTGRFPSASQDIAETVPATQQYASLATIVSGKLNFRTAFFQSAKGNFESRPGLVYNLGFDKFSARDDLNDPNSFLGYLACDEFSMLQPITEWIEKEQKPFLLTVLCSVTHDPYEVPQWFATPAKEPLERYRQAISYTDGFLAALDVELAKLGLTSQTIFCIIGDHGEAFGEHGLLGHERIAFEEVLRIPWVIRAPFLVEPASKVTEPVSSVDLTPTLLALLGFDISGAAFDGINVLGPLPDDRRVYFSGWMHQGPAGFVDGRRKFIYNPTNKIVCCYDLNTDPLEAVRIEPLERQAKRIVDDIVAWRKNSIFRINQQRTGKKLLFDQWLCSWTGRVSSVKYCP